MADSKPPRRLDPNSLDTFAVDRRGDWLIESLLMTIHGIRADAFDYIEELKRAQELEVATLKMQLSTATENVAWFQTTYGVRAHQPYYDKRSGGTEKCPKCCNRIAKSFHRLADCDTWSCPECGIFLADTIGVDEPPEVVQNTA